MSGRDLRSFVTHHRADVAEKLVIQARAGLLGGKIKPVDYNELWALAAEKRIAGQESLTKVKKLQDLSKFRKEQTTVKQHKAIWLKELARLNQAAKRIQAEIDLLTEETGTIDPTKIVFDELEAYERKISADFIDFKEKTLEPINSLRDDLKFWLQMKSSRFGSSTDQEDGDDDVQFDNPEQVQETVQFIRQQQQQILERLSQEQSRLESELNINGIYDSSLPPDRQIETGIPEEAFDVECPDLHLKTSVLQEFILIDGRYVEKLTNLEAEHRSAISVKNDGWSDEDHSFFLYVNDQYTYEIKNKRSLLIDCLKKHLPGKSRNEIVDHENWWMRYRFYHKRRHDLLSDWMRDRTELLNRAKVVFGEACRVKDLREEKQESLQKQRDFCEALYAKVRDWREKKMEMLKLEHEIAERRRQDMVSAVAAEEEKQKAKRNEQKRKVKEFHDRLETQKQVKAENERHRFEELQQYLAEQAVYDKERVKFREEEIRKKEEDKQRKRQEDLAAKDEKERILEAIRQKVRPHVEGDLLRLWSDTIAWQARQKPDEDVCLLKPLYDVKTFTAEQVAADPRFRLEERLRQMGLHNVDYARQAMATVKPLHAPRRDMESTVFKNA